MFKLSLTSYYLARQMERLLNPLINLTRPSGKEPKRSVRVTAHSARGGGEGGGF